MEEFVEAVAMLRMDNCFNPYADRYDPFDVEDAPKIRRSNLRHVLKAAAETSVDDLWIGLELGHNGGRRTGLAMTDDTHLLAHGSRFGVAGLLRRATQAGPTKEVTAGTVWEALSRVERPVFLWNVVPVHPHRPEEPLSNRRHTATEREICVSHLHTLIELLRPKRIVTVGTDAAIALKRCGYPHVPVRHPAFGGRRQFLKQIAALDQ
ncbi:MULTISPECIES: uracil-DNA glycosylase [unclassified Sphingomonas]|uniref:uracil-DNA glycosylase n=1 Tax=unclassified Sphingomonas TaxID=196159 RepID=UPI0021519605|nr:MULTISPECIES: uracil-DNA glycosylase [unclassified Sphingomonas]MCR5870352.1 uracil-DNA glycosylase [Sphingomonas sp. J344]UUY01313.1 uracil-DNA glycosylase [Sphingomonas sp. J315]